MTVTLIVSALCAAAGLLTFLVTIVAAEIVTALPASTRRPIVRHGTRPRLVVLVPAHNEGSGLIPTLSDIQRQLLSNDRVLVVADNCTDDTAEVARARGAEVVERHDTTRVGKGYALDKGLQHLSSNPPEVVVIIDADCRVENGTIEQLALTCAATGRPVQSVNVVTSPYKSLVNHKVAEFAGRVKRWVRPLGLSVFGLPCQLTGTGMAFPFNLLHSADLTSGSITEDLKLGLELSLAGYSPVFCPSARVTSEFPSSIKGTRTQRERWEQGHIDMILKDAFRLVVLAIARHNWQLLALTLDFAVPPLSLLGILLANMLGLTLLAAFFGLSSAPLIVITATLFEFIAAIFVAWLICGRDLLPASSILSLVTYMTGKVGLYIQILAGKGGARWDRTDRNKQE